MPVFDLQPGLGPQDSALGETPEEAARQLAFQEVAEQERKVLARALHDTLCQSLSGLQLLVRVAEQKALRECPAMTGDLGELKEVVRKMGDEVHRLIESLQPPSSSHERT